LTHISRLWVSFLSRAAVVPCHFPSYHEVL
jgi:hypothetical protein